MRKSWRFAPADSEFSKLWSSMTQTNRDEVMALAARGKCNPRQVYLDAARYNVSRVKNLFRPAANDEKEKAAAEKIRARRERNWLRWARAEEKRFARERRERKRAEAPHLKWLARRQAETDKFSRREGTAFRRGWEIALWDVVLGCNGRQLPGWASDALVEYARRLAPKLPRKGVMGRKARYKETQRQMAADFRILPLMEYYIEDRHYSEEKARALVAEEVHLSEGGIAKSYTRAKRLMKSGDYYFSPYLYRND